MKVTLKKLKIASLISEKYRTQTAMTNAMGVSRTYLYLLLSAEQCSIRGATLIAKALGVNLQDIIHENIDQ